MRISSIPRLSLSIVLALVPSGALMAQVHQEWLARYDTAGRQDNAERMTLDGGGNIVILGFSEVTPGFFTLRTLKYDPQGTLLWDRTFGSSAGWFIGGLAVDASGNVVISASPATSSAATNQILTVKYDAAGNEMWVRTFDPFGCGGANAGGVTTDATGNVYVSGTFVDCQAPNSATAHLGTVKLDPAGNALWTVGKRSKRGEVARAVRLATDAPGNLYVAGLIQYGPGNEDILAIRYDSDGQPHWTKRVRNGRGVDLDVSAPDTLIVGATSLVSGTESNFVVLGFAASNGRPLWTTTLDSGPADDLQAIAVRDGAVYACGWSTQPSGSDSDFLVARMTQAGVEWSRRFDRGNQDQCTDIAVDAAGNAYATGVTNTQPTYLDFTTLRYDVDGTLAWAEHYNGPDIPIPADGADAVAVTPANGVVVTGSSTAVNQLYDIVTILYGQP